MAFRLQLRGGMSIGSAGKRTSGRDRCTLDSYLHEVSAYSVMSAAQERSTADWFFELRVDVWHALLSRPSRREQIFGVIERVLTDDVMPYAEIADVRRVSSPARPRVREDAGPSETRHAACDTLARWLVHADPSLAIPAAIVAETSDSSRLPEAMVAEVRRALARVVAARNRFACANLRLVVNLVQQYGRHHLSLEDRVQEGNLGLLIAVDRFDASLGFRFSTYAAWWIRHTITRALVNYSRTVRVPAHLHTLYLKIQKAERQLGTLLRRQPTLDEVAVAIGEQIDKIQHAERVMQARTVGPDASISTRGSGTLTVADLLSDETLPDLDEQLDHRRSAAIISDRFDELNELEREIVVLRYGLDGAARKTLTDIGARKGLSRERIRQLQNRALSKLRTIIETSPIPSCAVA